MVIAKATNTWRTLPFTHETSNRFWFIHVTLLSKQLSFTVHQSIPSTPGAACCVMVSSMFLTIETLESSAQSNNTAFGLCYEQKFELFQRNFRKKNQGDGSTTIPISLSHRYHKDEASLRSLFRTLCCWKWEQNMAPYFLNSSRIDPEYESVICKLWIDLWQNFKLHD